MQSPLPLGYIQLIISSSLYLYNLSHIDNHNALPIKVLKTTKIIVPYPPAKVLIDYTFVASLLVCKYANNLNKMKSSSSRSLQDMTYLLGWNPPLDQPKCTTAFLTWNLWYIFPYDIFGD